MPHSADTGSGWDDAALEAAEQALVDALFAALAQPRLDAELAAQDEAVALISSRMRLREHRGGPALSVSVPGGRWARLAVAAVGVFAATSGAAFAGVLPHAAQDVAGRALSAVGLHAPSGHPAKSDDTGSEGGPAAGHPDVKGATVSDIAHDPTLRGREKGAAASGVARAGHGSAAQEHGGDAAAGSPDASHGRGIPPADPGGSHPAAPAHPQHPPTGPPPGAGDGSGTSGSTHSHGGDGGSASGGGSSGGHAAGGGNGNHTTG